MRTPEHEEEQTEFTENTEYPEDGEQDVPQDPKVDLSEGVEFDEVQR